MKKWGFLLTLFLVYFSIIHISQAQENIDTEWGMDATHWDVFPDRGLDLSNYNTTQTEVLNNIKNIGAKWIRIGLWEDRGRVDGNYPDLSGYDSYINEANSLELKVLANLLTYCGWETMNEWDENWYSFVEIIVNRYKGKIHAYQILNEEDDPNCNKCLFACDGVPWTIWPTKIDFANNPEKYVEIFNKTYEIIKNIDPEAIVISGGTTRDDDGSYIENLISLGITVDAVATHHYGTIETIDTELVPKVDRLGQLNKSIWITETGQNAEYAGIEYQKDWIEELVCSLGYKAERPFWFSYTYIIDENGYPTESYYTFKDFISDLCGLQPAGCSGEINLTLLPKYVKAGENVKAHVSGLTSCDDKLVVVLGPDKCQIVLPENSCNLKAPSSLTSTDRYYEVKAIIDMDEDGNAGNDLGEVDTETLTVYTESIGGGCGVKCLEMAWYTMPYLLEVVIPFVSFVIISIAEIIVLVLIIRKLHEKK
ncbi:MAG: hypothetical protein GTN36_03755 [Candidatus Aenigmarchaeota archaeon]|nr:hypothetical protein [Candidatus Aenigmarchaeota archaeon]